MLKRFAWLSVLIVLTAGGYYAWSQNDRSFVPPAIDTHVMNSAVYGNDSGKGNLIGIQPYMFSADYCSRETFLAKMEAYFRIVKDQGWLNDKTVIVLPEYLGTWLVVEKEKGDVYKTASMNEAMQLMVESNVGSFMKGFVISPAANRTEYALFAMKSNSMAEAYNYVFSQLAQKFKVTIVAGSIVLAEPSIQDGRLVSERGPLYSVSPVYGPDGKVQALTYKCFPISTEQPFLKAASIDQLAVTDTPVGKMGITVCADSWYQPSYEVMKRKGAEVVVVPSYTMGDGEMEKPWLGYSGYPTPTDVDPSDLNKITLQQAWDKYTLPGRLPSIGIMNGLIVCLRGQLWDLGSDGSCTIVKDGQRFNQPNIDGADLVNFWL